MKTIYVYENKESNEKYLLVNRFYCDLFAKEIIVARYF